MNIPTDGHGHGHGPTQSLHSFFQSLQNNPNHQDYNHTNIHFDFTTQLQAHPHLANINVQINTNTNANIFVTSKDIKPGMELFVSRDKEQEVHPYNFVDEIIKDMMGLIPRSPGQKVPKKIQG